MASENGQKPDVPTFDFTHWSHKKARELQLMAKRVAFMEGRIDAFDGTLDEFDAALSELEGMLKSVNATICEFLVSVPSSWLVADAPDKLDWDQPESLDWLRQDKYMELSAAAQEARKPENVSGN